MPNHARIPRPLHDRGDHTLARVVAIARIVHEADLEDERYDAPEARGLDVLMRGLSLIKSDGQVLALSAPLYDGLYEYLKRAGLPGREPS